MRKALIVGLDHYQASPLTGCVNDALRIGHLLERHEDGSKNFVCNGLTSAPNAAPITADDLRRELHRLIKEPVSYAVFHFSGHGSDQDGKPSLVAQDGSLLRLDDVLEVVNRSNATQTLVTLDCCFAGGMGAVNLLPKDHALVREGVALVVGTRRDEAATERGGGGVFSDLVVGALEGGASDVRGVVTFASLHTYVDEGLGAWEQRPALRANVSKLEPLRQCKPLVEEAILRQLPDWFPDPQATFPLTPDFEPEASPQDPDKQAIFMRLQKCNRARLVDPVGREHMYHAAMDSTGCRLTHLGLRYWRMAREGLL